MKNNSQLDLFKKHHDSWSREVKLASKRDSDFDTISGETQDICYFPNFPEEEYLNKLGFPGQFPFTGKIIMVVLERLHEKDAVTLKKETKARFAASLSAQ